MADKTPRPMGKSNDLARIKDVEALIGMALYNYHHLFHRTAPLPEPDAPPADEAPAA
jgi:hypothetical protein